MNGQNMKPTEEVGVSTKPSSLVDSAFMGLTNFPFDPLTGPGPSALVDADFSIFVHASKDGPGTEEQSTSKK